MVEIRRWAATRPIYFFGTWTVDKAGSVYSHMGMSSKPTTAISSGTR